MIAGRSIRAVIFDCDGVLIDSEALALEVEQKNLAEVGLTFDLDRRRQFLGLSYLDALRELDAEALRRTGRRLPADFAARIGRDIRKLFEERLTPIDGAVPLVRDLAMPKGVASSSVQTSLEWKLAKTGLADLFRGYVYSSELVPHGKPAPDLFFLVAERIGAVPETTLVVEDSANGIRGARAAGMIAAGFTAGGHCGPGHRDMLLSAGADVVLSSFAELRALLAMPAP